MLKKIITVFPAIILVVLLCSGISGNYQGEKPCVEFITAHGGMPMILVKGGDFIMGNTDGEYDEIPEHMVKIKNPFYISANLISFNQYELFCPGFRDSLRERKRITYGNEVNLLPEYAGGLEGDSAVVGVTWHNAVAFCEWLNKKEGRSAKKGDGMIYRLPTEAEWEYAFRNDTTQVRKLHNMLGVEQWMLDWYGPYGNKPVTDPAGYRYGTHKVTRGGSEWTLSQSMRLTNRMSFLPIDRFPRLGFRIVLGRSSMSYLKLQPVPLCEKDVSRKKYDWKAHPVPNDTAEFIPPVTFVKIPAESNGPLFSKHNHFPAITWCANGDLLATWYSCLTESGTQVNIACSRLRKGSMEWEPASLFWIAADRNNHSSALWTDDKTGRIYHFQGTGSHPNQANQILVMRYSDDNGATWTAPRIINTIRSMWNPHVVMKTREGTIIVTSDLNFGQPILGRIILSHDNGETWHSPPGYIIGQHPGIVQLENGNLMAVGRDNWNNEHQLYPGIGLPISESNDLGETWSYRREPSLGMGIASRQRPVLIRLQEGPILYVGFTDKKGDLTKYGMVVTDASGKQRKIYGLFSALSFDEGKTWTYHKLITPGAERKEYDGGGNTGLFIADAEKGEPYGYMQAMQSPDGMIHLISSKLHYRFNLAWLKTPTVSEKH